MSRQQLKLLSIVILVPFTGLTGWALYEFGGTGIIAYQLQTSAGIQVLVDLIIACLLFLVWMFRDAKIHGRNPWPWVALTLVAGSYGPLLYLATAKVTPETF